jgi:hypothetical protein
MNQNMVKNKCFRNLKRLELKAHLFHKTSSGRLLERYALRHFYITERVWENQTKKGGCTAKNGLRLIQSTKTDI